jgi:hypothetical protein
MPQVLDRPRVREVHHYEESSTGFICDPQPQRKTVTHHRPRKIDLHFWVTSAIALLAVFAEFAHGCSGGNGH